MADSVDVSAMSEQDRKNYARAQSLKERGYTDAADEILGTLPQHTAPPPGLGTQLVEFNKVLFNVEDKDAHFVNIASRQRAAAALLGHPTDAEVATVYDEPMDDILMSATAAPASRSSDHLGTIAVLAALALLVFMLVRRKDHASAPPGNQGAGAPVIINN